MRSGNDFFAHDLRNRLTVARGFVELIRAGRTEGDPEKREHYLELVCDALSQAMELVDENEKESGKEDLVSVAENRYQAKLIERLYEMFPGCEILKNDAGYRQGIPDLTIMWGKFWAMLEVKASENASEQPNQSYYVNRFNDMSFAAKIYPENEEEVLSALQKAFSPGGAACVSKS